MTARLGRIRRAGPVLAVRVECSAGTYVRVLAADLGAALGGGAYVRRLRRTAVGPWSEAMATRLEDLSVGDVIAPAASLPWLVSVAVDTERAREIENGRVLQRDGFGGHGDGPWRVIGPNGDLLAIYQGMGPIWSNRLSSFPHRSNELAQFAGGP